MMAAGDYEVHFGANALGKPGSLPLQVPAVWLSRSRSSQRRPQRCRKSPRTMLAAKSPRAWRGPRCLGRLRACPGQKNAIVA